MNVRSPGGVVPALAGGAAGAVFGAWHAGLINCYDIVATEKKGYPTVTPELIATGRLWDDESLWVEKPRMPGLVKTLAWGAASCLGAHVAGVDVTTLPLVGDFFRWTGLTGALAAFTTGVAARVGMNCYVTPAFAAFVGGLRGAMIFGRGVELPELPELSEPRTATSATPESTSAPR